MCCRSVLREFECGSADASQLLPQIEICGDRGNGEEDARRAAEAAGGKLRIPSFNAGLIQKFKAITGGNQPTDWNDFFIATEDL